MTLREAQEGTEYIIREIETDDEELNAFLFSLGCYSGEKITVISRRKGGCTVAIKDARYNIDNQGQKVGGLTHYLSGQVSLENIINSTNVPNLYLMLAGPLSPNPAELMSGHLIDDLLSKCRKIFDMIIIDTPPLGAVIDAAILAPKCDGVVIVTEANSTSARVAIGVKKQLEMTGCKILGCVLNKVPSTGTSYRYRYRYYGEYEYKTETEDGETKKKRVRTDKKKED